MKRKLISFYAALLLPMAVQAQEHLTGTWHGTLDKFGLTMVLHVDSSGTCTMDSPDQSVYGIEAKADHLSKDSLHLVAQGGVQYAARLHGDTLRGVFVQGFQAMRLTMQPGPLVRHRPQTPQPPYPYTTEEVTFVNEADGVTLAGTLCRPRKKHVPVVLMVTGSGPENRDEELMGHRPFAVIADYLARHGIASLRYDDRGCYASTGTFKGSTTTDFARDAEAGLRFLRNWKGAESSEFSSIGILGHSEGGAIVFILAGKEGLADFGISLAGPGVKGDTLLVVQENAIARQQGKKPFYQNTQQVHQNPSITLDPWYKYFVNYDPSDDLRRIHIPIMAINGERDLQVDYQQNLTAIRRLLPADKRHLIRSYPTLNHLFQHCQTGLPSEYGSIEETISDEVLHDIGQWILQHNSTTRHQSPVGIISYQDTMRTAQIGLVASIAESKASGLQLSGLANMSASPFHGIQLSGISNIAMGVERGIQLTTLLNVSSGYMRGMQMGAYNYADSLNGTQIGVINVARSHPKGWQVGIINTTRDTVAHKIGLVNLNPLTTIDYMVFAGTSSKLNGAIRFRNRSTYNIIGVGTHYMGLDSKFSGALYYRIGQYFHLSPRWTISGDVGFAHIETFERHNANKPERLYSLMARLNADYQVSERVGVFASVGWSDTRYYHHATRYRNRPLLEAGLTLRHQRGQNKWYPQPIVNDLPPLADSLMALPQKKHPWRAAALVTGINAFVHCFDRFVLNEDFAESNLHTIHRNFKNGFVWDNDQFSTNLFAHPYHGNLYFNAARSNGLTFWESAPYSMFGSLMWEFMGEVEPPAINDLIATTIGGIGIGEVTHRISNVILNDRTHGFGRFLREAAATVISPIKGFNRIVSGRAWKVSQQNYLYHDIGQFPVDCSLSVGNRYLADNGALFRGEHNPYLNFYLEYGDPLNEDEHNQPYDFFDLEVTFGLSKNQPLINNLHLLGRIWSTPMLTGKGIEAEVGIYQHFNYYDSKPVKDGSDLTPYRISEAASLGPGAIFSFPTVGVVTRLEQRIFLSGILLGGTKSDYYSFIDRDYNMGSGYSLKTKTHVEMHHFGRLILHANYFQIFTWKGYEQKDLTNVDPLHLNAQGDKGNARLFVASSTAEIDIKDGWSLLVEASTFSRRTHYKYYDDVKANTFELRAGLTYHF